MRLLSVIAGISVAPDATQPTESWDRDWYGLTA